MATFLAIWLLAGLIFLAYAGISAIYRKKNNITTPRAKHFGKMIGLSVFPLVLLIIGLFLQDDKPSTPQTVIAETKAKSRQEWTKETSLERVKREARMMKGLDLDYALEHTGFYPKINAFIEKAIQENQIEEKAREAFSNCIKWTIWKKSDEVTLDIPLRSCVGDYRNDVLMKQKYFDPSFVMGNFSEWDGSNAIIIKRINEAYKDYDHEKTRFRLGGDELVIMTTYFVNTPFGRVYKRYTAKLNPNGQIIEEEDLVLR